MKKRFVLIITITFLIVVGIFTSITIIHNSPYRWSRELIDAIENNDIQEATLLLQQNYDVNTPSSKPNRIMDAFLESSPTVPLAKACYIGNYDMVKLLIDHGATASHIDGTGWSPLHQALIHYQEDDLWIIPLLLDNGADPNYIESDTPPIMLVANLLSTQQLKNEDALVVSLEIFKILEERGADIDYINNRGDNIVIESAIYGNKLLLEYLLQEKKFDVNYKNDLGMTPLMGSVSLEQDINKRTIQILLNNGADKNLKDNNGKTAYDYAIENGNEEFAELLRPE